MKNGAIFSIIIAMLMATLMSGQSAFADEDAEHYVEVSGTGTASGKPDTALLSLTVLRTGKTARLALDANNAAMKKVLAGITNAGITNNDMQTSGFSMQPKYSYPGPGKNGQRPAPVLTGYAVSNQLTVKVRNLEKVGAVLDEAVSLGVNRIGNIKFMVSDPGQLREQARVAAMKDARRKAVVLTKAGDVSLGKIRFIREHSASDRPQPMMMAQRTTMESAAAVPVATGEITWSVRVNVRWALKP
jgi:uncharacterized protein